MLVHPSSIDLSSHILRYLTGRLRARRRETATRWRRLPAGRRALRALAHPRCGDTPPASGRGTPNARFAAGFRIGTATACRSLRGVTDVPATLALTPDETMKTVRTKAFVILDGTLPPTGRSLPAPCTPSGNTHATA